jgi:uncharacterized protein YdbL (DUF1318 family)
LSGGQIDVQTAGRVGEQADGKVIVHTGAVIGQADTAVSQVAGARGSSNTDKPVGLPKTVGKRTETCAQRAARL